MDLRVLRYFLATVEWGSLTDGANALHVSQPTISRQLRALEAELGTPLFERGHGALRLTHAGRRFHPMALDLIRREERARTSLSTAQTPNEQRLLALAPPATIQAILAPFLAADPALPLLDAVECDPLDVFNQVARRGADLGISTLAPPAGWTSVSMGRLPVQVHVSPEHPLAGLTAIDLDDLLAYPLVLLDRSNSARLAFDEAATKAGLQPLDTIEMRSSSMAQGVARGRGIAAVLSTAPLHGLIDIPILAAGHPIELHAFAGWESDHYAADTIVSLISSLKAWVLRGSSLMEAPR